MIDRCSHFSVKLVVRGQTLGNVKFVLLEFSVLYGKFQSLFVTAWIRKVLVTFEISLMSNVSFESCDGAVLPLWLNST